MLCHALVELGRHIHRANEGLNLQLFVENACLEASCSSGIATKKIALFAVVFIAVEALLAAIILQMINFVAHLFSYVKPSDQSLCLRNSQYR